jgi:glycosyltransferase involved in cell wall biosynthesis
VQHDLNYSVPRRSRIPDLPPIVPPLDKTAQRPQWSVMIPVYNCSAYLPDALRSVLCQAPGESEMQIEVIDDGSTDADVAALVLEIGKGRVGYFRQSENVGSLRNFQTCLERSRGHLIHILHGDDVVRRGYYEKTTRLFDTFSSIGAAFCRYAYIDEHGRFLYHHEEELDRDGILPRWLSRLCERQRIQYVAITVKREVYENVGGFYGVEYGEDWEMWARIAARYPMAYTPEVLAEYRKHYSSISGKSFLTGKNMDSLRWVMQRIQPYLAQGERAAIADASRKFYAHYALRVANTLWTKFKHRRGALAQALAAWKMSRDAGLLYKILKLYTRITLNI